jgi:hypothetical protein
MRSKERCQANVDPGPHSSKLCLQLFQPRFEFCTDAPQFYTLYSRKQAGS